MIRTGLSLTAPIKRLIVSSEAFESGGFIPEKYTCDGKNVNPPLDIYGIPKETKSLVIIVEDPDAPVRAWSHWIVWNIKPTRKLKEDNSPGIEGINDFGTNGYGGPCPPKGIHHYHFKIYALDRFLALKPQTAKYELEKTMGAYVIAFGELVGLYKRAV